MHSSTINWGYKSKLHFLYGGTSYCFCTMRVLGKIINANGLDMSLSIAGIYGTTAVEQINS